MSLIIVAVLFFIVAGLIGVGIVLFMNSGERSGIHSDPHRPAKPEAPLTTEELKELEKLPPEVAQALVDRKKVLAITLYRKDTGLGLKEAKLFIDRIEGHDLIKARAMADPVPHSSSKTLASPSSGPFKELENLSPKIGEALQNGNKILAIKEYRVETGSSLKEAKEFIESIEGYYR